MRLLAISLALSTLLACGEDEPERNAPPVGSGGGAPVATASGGGTGSDTDASGTGGGSGGGGSTTSGDASSGGPSVFDVLSGRFVDGGGGYALPITCTVKFHRPGQINPSSGIETGEVFSRAILIDAFPQAFTISSDEIGEPVVQGEAGFVSSECDIDGNELFDDDAGAYYPALPMVEISIPASSIELAVGPV